MPTDILSSNDISAAALNTFDLANSFLPPNQKERRRFSTCFLGPTPFPFLLSSGFHIRLPRFSNRPFSLSRLFLKLRALSFDRPTGTTWSIFPFFPPPVPYDNFFKETLSLREPASPPSFLGISRRELFVRMTSPSPQHLSGLTF